MSYPKGQKKILNFFFFFEKMDSALGGGWSTPRAKKPYARAKLIFFLKKKTLNFFWPLGLADPPQGPRGGFGVAEATPYAILRWLATSYGVASHPFFLKKFFINFLYFYFDLNLFFKKITKYLLVGLPPQHLWRKCGLLISLYKIFAF